MALAETWHPGVCLQGNQVWHRAGAGHSCSSSLTLGSQKPRLWQQLVPAGEGFQVQPRKGPFAEYTLSCTAHHLAAKALASPSLAGHRFQPSHLASPNPSTMDIKAKAAS